MLLVCLLFLFANFYAAVCLLKLKEHADLIALCYPPGTIQASALESLTGNEEKGEAAVFSKAVLWKSLGENWISTEQTGRGRKVSCYQMKGQPEAVFGTDLIYGRYFTDEENLACLLDQDTARQLFGSDHVLGMEIQVNEKNCQITGVLRGKRPVCVISAGNMESTGNTPVQSRTTDGRDGADSNMDSDCYDGAAIRKQKAEESSSIAISRLESVFGSSSGQKIDNQLYYVTACLFYFGALALIVILAGITMGKERQRKWIYIAGLSAAAGVLYLGIRCAAPGSDYLPTYWSDFGFFSRLFQEKAEQIRGLAVHQEFDSWQNLLHIWQQAIAVEMYIGISSVIVTFYHQYSRSADNGIMLYTKKSF